MRHRARRRRRKLVAGGVLAGLLVLALMRFWPSEHAPRSAVARTAPAAERSPAVEPTGRARPEYLNQSYRAPPGLVRPSAGGTLRIASVGIRAPVDAVGLDGTAMAVPDDPDRVGWLSSTARLDDLLGASVLAGHVSDRRDRPGAFARLRLVRRGARVTWTDAQGIVRRFRVVHTEQFPRSRGLPAELFRTDGPHRLYLVTCANRETTKGGGFHYRSNLVVTAVR